MNTDVNLMTECPQCGQKLVKFQTQTSEGWACPNGHGKVYR